MKKICWLVLVGAGILAAGCTTTQPVVVKETMVIPAGKSLTLQAPSNLPGAALKVTVAASAIKEIPENVAPLVKDVTLTGWLVINADTNKPAK